MPANVKYKPQWQDEGDEAFTFVAMEDEDGGRVCVGIVGCLASCIPNHIANVDWIESHAPGGLHLIA